MSSAPELDRRTYFGSLAVLLLEANELESDILTQVLLGFKVRSTVRFADAGDAQGYARGNSPDLIIAGAVKTGMGQPDEYDFIRSVRHSKGEERAVPIILLAGHTSQSNVIRARDCGASVVVAKPITPQVLYDRLVWLSKDARTFITSPGYAGPDRRFQTLGPPAGTEGRRRDDLSLKVGTAKAPNLSQSEIDAFRNAKGAVR